MLALFTISVKSSSRAWSLGHSLVLFARDEATRAEKRAKLLVSRAGRKFWS